MIITDNRRPRQQDNEGQPLKGIDGTRLYGIWSSMHTRCYDQNCKAYPRYGERGINVCWEWHHDNVKGFYNFKTWALQNGYTEDLTIDRINNDGDYTPSNCQWTTPKEQSRNRNCNQPITVDGVEYRTLSEAIEAYGREEDYFIIRYRIQHGYTPERAFTEPITEHCKPIIYDGVEYESVSECCKALNLNHGTVLTYKQRNGTTTEEAIEHYVTKDNITINGVQYRTLAEACRALNINPTAIRNYKHRHNATAEEAIEHYTPKDNITINGQTYKTIIEACKALNLSLSMVKSYKCRHRTTTEEAIAHYLV